MRSMVTPGMYINTYTPTPASTRTHATKSFTSIFITKNQQEPGFLRNKLVSFISSECALSVHKYSQNES